jgi:hypothetical protein
LTILIGVASLSQSLAAAETDSRDGVLEIHHRDGRIINKSFKSEITAPQLVQQQTYRLRPKERLSVVVVDPNPLLYTYSWGGLTAADTADYKTATDFAKSLDPLISAFAPKTVTGRSLPLTPVTVAPEVASALKAIGIPNEKDFLNNFLAHYSAVENLVDAIPSLMVKACGTPAEASEAKTAVRGSTWDLDATAKIIKKDFDLLKLGRGALLKLVATEPAKVANDLFYIASNLFADRESEITAALGTLSTFKKDVMAVDEPITLSPEAIAYSFSKDQTVTFSIGRRDQVQVPKEATARITGKYTIVISPLYPVRLGIGAAAVYSFAPNNTYKAVNDGTQLVVIRDPSTPQYEAFNLAAVLTITPRKWDDPSFGGYFQLGVQPKDRVGLFFGLAVRVMGLFDFGGGFTLQQVDQLAGGLVEGGAISSASSIVTSRVWKSSGYLHVTVSSPLGK